MALQFKYMTGSGLIWGAVVDKKEVLPVGKAAKPVKI
jgi:hypothetical protein